MVHIGEPVDPNLDSESCACSRLFSMLMVALLSWFGLQRKEDDPSSRNRRLSSGSHLSGFRDGAHGQGVACPALSGSSEVGAMSRLELLGPCSAYLPDLTEGTRKSD